MKLIVGLISEFSNFKPICLQTAWVQLSNFSFKYFFSFWKLQFETYFFSFSNKRYFKKVEPFFPDWDFVRASSFDLSRFYTMVVYFLNVYKMRIYYWYY